MFVYRSQSRLRLRVQIVSPPGESIRIVAGAGSLAVPRTADFLVVTLFVYPHYGETVAWNF